MTKDEQILMSKYRNVLFSSLGMEVLTDILVEFCNFGQFIDPDDRQAIRNYNVGVGILIRLGVFAKETNPLNIIRSFSQVTPNIRTEEVEE